jgi:hypothetical protein
VLTRAAPPLPLPLANSLSDRLAPHTRNFCWQYWHRAHKHQTYYSHTQNLNLSLIYILLGFVYFSLILSLHSHTHQTCIVSVLVMYTLACINGYYLLILSVINFGMINFVYCH